MFLVITRDRKSFLSHFRAPWKPNQISISSLQPKEIIIFVSKNTVFCSIFEKMSIMQVFLDFWHNLWRFVRALDDFKRKKFLETIKLCTKNTFRKNQSAGCQNLLNTFYQMISKSFYGFWITQWQKSYKIKNNFKLLYTP